MQEQNLNEQLQNQAADSGLQKIMADITTAKETSLLHTENSEFSGERAGGTPADRVAVLGGGSGRHSKALMASALAAAAAGNMAMPFLGGMGMKRFTGSKVYRDIELTPMERMQRDMAVKTHNAQVEMQRKLKKDAKKTRAEVKAALK